MSERQVQTGWSKGIVRLDDTPERLALSVVFTWDLPEVRAICLQETQREVLVGGPAVKLMPDYLAGYATIGEDWPGALRAHNAEATRTTMGCRRGCSFCAVTRIEGAFRELDDWQPARVIADSNLLFASRKHIERVVNAHCGMLNLDLQGLDARLLKPWHIELLQWLNLKVLRLAWDKQDDETAAMAAADALHEAGIPKRAITLYCLINAGETPDEALYRMETCKARGYKAYPMRLQKLDALKRNECLAPEWQEWELRRFVRFWSRQHMFDGVDFADYEGCVRSRGSQGRLFEREG